MTATPNERLARSLYPDRYGSWLGRALWRFGDRLEDFACARCGIDPLEDDALCTGVWSYVETAGVRIKAHHARKVRGY